MRKTRFMSLLFLVWSIAFFFVADFRQGLQGPLMALGLMGDYGLFARADALPRKVVEQAAGTAEQQRDGRTLAIVAIHSPDSRKRSRFAQEAVALDPALSWVYVSLYFNDHRFAVYNPELDKWVARLEKWDHDNAFPYLLEGIQAGDRRGTKFPSPSRLDLLAQETEWRDAMKKAFAAPRYESYSLQRFDLERAWLRERHLDRPAIILYSVATYPVPSLLHIRMYASLLVKKLAKEAEEAGRIQEALSYGWTVAHMGERMRLQGISLLEKLIGASLQDLAYEQLIPLLRKTGRLDEAVSLEYAEKHLHQQLDTFRGKDPFAKSTNYFWAAVMVHIFVAFVAVFGFLTVICFAYVTAKRWVRPEKKGRFFQLIIVAQNYMPILLFLACLGLYLNYYPYAQNFHYYMTASGEIHDLEPLFYNVFPNFIGPPGQNALAPQNPFRPYAWYALAGLVLAVLMAVPYPRRKPPTSA